MKAEPLKGKVDCTTEFRIGESVASEEDIKSAIEWLKSELKERELLNFVIENLIDTAFEDVK
jgi:hypothetical protein